MGDRHIFRYTENPSIYGRLTFSARLKKMKPLYDRRKINRCTLAAFYSFIHSDMDSRPSSIYSFSAYPQMDLMCLELTQNLSFVDGREPDQIRANGVL